MKHITLTLSEAYISAIPYWLYPCKSWCCLFDSTSGLTPLFDTADQREAETVPWGGTDLFSVLDALWVICHEFGLLSTELFPQFSELMFVAL